MTDYWNNAVLNRRLSRRRAIVAAGGSIAGGTILAACGGSGSDGSGSSTGGSGLVTKPVDTTREAKRGGVFKDSTRTDAATFDPYTLASSEPRRAIVWSRLTKVKPGVLEPSTGEVEGDLASSWEVAGDKLQVTFKLRRDAKLDPRAPTNGRAVEAKDVLYSWERLLQIGARRGDLANSINSGASVTSVTAPDSSTIVMKLAFPDADLLSILAATASGNFHILPVETEGGYEIKSDNRGSGPYYISDHKPSLGITYQRNPGYYDKNVAFIDTFESPILSEYGSALAQLRAGQIYRFPEGALRLEDVVPLKTDIPEMLLVQTGIQTATTTSMFGFRDVPGSQFRDERVRQAYSLSLDRDLWIDTFLNVTELGKQGLPVDTLWNSCLVCHDAGWYLDPQGKDFGENAKYYKHDVAQAKSLLAAAGYPDGFETNGHHIAETNYGLDYLKQIIVQVGMLNEAGIRVKLVSHGFRAEWGKEYRDAKGDFDGVGWLNVSPLADVGGLTALYSSQGSLFKGFTPDGSSTFAGDPKLDDLTTQIKQEFDRPKRFEFAHELQRYVGKMQYNVRFPGGGSGFDLGWPVIGNYGVYRGGTGGTITSGPDTLFWIDERKAPLKNA